MPCSVSGVTTAPSEMPISTKIAARQQRRHQHRPAGKRGGGDGQDRARQPAGGHADEAERGAAGLRNGQRFGRGGGEQRCDLRMMGADKD